MHLSDINRYQKAFSNESSKFKRSQKESDLDCLFCAGENGMDQITRFVSLVDKSLEKYVQGNELLLNLKSMRLFPSLTAGIIDYYQDSRQS